RGCGEWQRAYQKRNEHTSDYRYRRPHDEITNYREQQRRRKKQLKFHKLRGMAVGYRFVGIFSDREHPPECELIFLCEVFRERFRVRVINNRLRSKLHFPTTSGHTVREFSILGTGHGKISVKSSCFQKFVAPERGRIGVNEVDIGKLCHPPVSVFVFNLHETRHYVLLSRPISALYAHGLRIIKWRKHCCKPTDCRNAVVISKQNKFAAGLPHAAVASCGWASICLRDKLDMRILSDNFRGIVPRSIINDQNLYLAWGFLSQDRVQTSANPRCAIKSRNDARGCEC